MTKRRIGSWMLAVGIVLTVVAAVVWHHEHASDGIDTAKPVQGLFYGSTSPPNHTPAIIMYVVSAASISGGVLLIRRRRTDLA